MILDHLLTALDKEVFESVIRTRLLSRRCKAGEELQRHQRNRRLQQVERIETHRTTLTGCDPQARGSFKFIPFIQMGLDRLTDKVSHDCGLGLEPMRSRPSLNRAR